MAFQVQPVDSPLQISSSHAPSGLSEFLHSILISNATQKHKISGPGNFSRESTERTALLKMLFVSLIDRSIECLK